MTAAATDTTLPLVRMRGITKRFGPVAVLHDVSFDVRPGEVHILAGENGAGKSTLMKIMGGVYTEYDGHIEIAGRPVRPRSPVDANRLGVAVIYQELSLIPSMSVADNIFLGRPPTSPGGFVKDGSQRRQSRDLLRRLGLDIDADALVGDLPIARQQLVEIAKATSLDARVLVMDEPTSALSSPEVDRLFHLIADLKSRGYGVVYISHKMEEIERIADRITVLRDGRLVGTADAKDLPVPKLIQWMVGRELGAEFVKHVPTGTGEGAGGGHTAGDVRLAIDNLHVRPPGARKDAVHDVSFTVRAGEIVGVAGLQGSGNSELLLGLFGAYGKHAVSGTVSVDGRPFTPRNPADAIRHGLALLTNDRKATGLVLNLSVAANCTLAALDEMSPAGWRSTRREFARTAELTGPLKLKAASLRSEVGSLSGGNQQKVALAKWLATRPRVLLLDEPTRGIDIAAKRDIYALMQAWAADGMAIVLISSEMPELLALSDRVIVLHRGRKTAELSRADATAERVLAVAMGDAGNDETRNPNDESMTE